MPPRSSPQRLAASLVLAWFLALLAVAGIAPWMQQAGADEVVCTGSGPAPASGDGTAGAAHGLHTLQCALCLGVSAPPSAPAVLADAAQVLPHVLLPLVAARLASLAGAPLPARGPPAFS